MKRGTPSRVITYSLLCILAFACSSEDAGDLFSKGPPPGDNVPRTGGVGGGAGVGGGTGSGVTTAGTSASQAGTQSTGGSGSIGEGGTSAESGGSTSSSGGMSPATGGGVNGGASAAGGDSSGSSGGNSSGGSSSDERCVSSATCGAGRYCLKSSCGAVNGRCADVPVGCGNDEEPVCGCDGYTYINRCLAALNSQSVARVGVCRETAVRCGGQTSCGARSRGKCVYFYERENQCPHNSFRFGACWVLPETCADHGKVELQPCGAGNQCRSLCEAAASGAPHRMGKCK
jgi:hypothetical protein